jgi:hypothetical protein
VASRCPPVPARSWQRGVFGCPFPGRMALGLDRCSRNGVAALKRRQACERMILPMNSGGEPRGGNPSRPQRGLPQKGRRGCANQYRARPRGYKTLRSGRTSRELRSIAATRSQPAPSTSEPLKRNGSDEFSDSDPGQTARRIPSGSCRRRPETPGGPARLERDGPIVPFAETLTDNGHCERLNFGSDEGDAAKSSASRRGFGRGMACTVARSSERATGREEVLERAPRRECRALEGRKPRRASGSAVAVETRHAGNELSHGARP